MPTPSDPDVDELMWWQKHGDRVLHIAAALISGGLAGNQTTQDPKDIIDMAAAIVREVTNRPGEV